MKKNNLLLLLAGLSIASCSGITLTPTPEKAAVNMKFDWGGGATPKSMKAYFYPTENIAGTSGLPVFAEGSGTEIAVQLPEGSYRAMAYNTDVTYVSFSEMNSYETATVSAGTVGTRNGGVTVEQPSAFYACALQEQVTTSLLDPVTVSAAPQQLTRALMLQIELSDIRGVDALEGTLCGIYPSLLLSTGTPSAASVAAAPTVKSAFRVDNPTELVTIEFRTLGILNPEGGKTYRSMMELVLLGNDNWRQDVTVDLTDVLTDVIGKNSNDLPIEVPVSIQLEIKPVGTSLQASVKSWSQGAGDGYVYE